MPTEIGNADLSDLSEILKLQYEAYIQEADIYNNYTIPPLLQNLDALIQEWNEGIVIKAVHNEQIIGSVRAKADKNICRIGQSCPKQF